MMNVNIKKERRSTIIKVAGIENIDCPVESAFNAKSRPFSRRMLSSTIALLGPAGGVEKDILTGRKIG